MSRTTGTQHDRHRKFNVEWELSEFQTPPKKKRRDDTEWRWMITPSWFIRLRSTRPKRKQTNTLLRRIHILHDLNETLDFPHPKHPKLHYW